jgi:Tetratricopeptide repeat
MGLDARFSAAWFHPVPTPHIPHRRRSGCAQRPCLNTLGAVLSGLGRREEALAAMQQAVDIRRPIAQTRPDAFLPDLAVSLHNLGLGLSNVGCHDRALAATQEALARPVEDQSRAQNRARTVRLHQVCFTQSSDVGDPGFDLLLPSDPSVREHPGAQGSRGRTLDVAWYSCRLNA